MLLHRRQILAAGTAALFAPKIAFAKAETERRLVFVIQRGAADGLATLAPIGDPAYSGLRGSLIPELADQPKLGGLEPTERSAQQGRDATYGSGF